MQTAPEFIVPSYHFQGSLKMITVTSPRKRPQKDGQKGSETPAPAGASAGGNIRRTKPVAPFFASKNLPPSSAIPSSSPAFATPVHPIKPFQAPAPAKAAILPIILPPATLRPLAFRTFTKKYSLTLTSTALQELASFIGRHCGSGWREEGLAEKVLEEVARSWKNRNGGVIVEGNSPELKDILKTLEGNMSGGKIISGPRGLSRQNSLMLESSQEAEHSQTRLGLRPAGLPREDSQSSLGMSGLDFSEQPDDETANDPRRWLHVINAFDQPRYTYNVAKKHFEKETTKPSLLPAASHKTDAFRNRFNVIHQRLLRNESFQTSAVAGAKGPSSRKNASGTMQSHKITPISNLLGRHGTHHMLLGMLVILPTGNLAISDLTGAIALDLSHAAAIPEDSAWFTPGMIVLIDGIYEEEEEVAGKGLSGSTGVGGTIGGRFQGFFIGQPPCEKRRATLGVSGPDGVGAADHTIGGGFGWIDFLGVGSERAVGTRMRRLEHKLLRQPRLVDPDAPPGRGRVVILGELALDQPRCLQALKKILGLYASDPPGSTPMTFILTGNFTTHAVMARGGSGGSIEYKEFFDALASTLADYPTLLTTATFVFVPGDNDGWVSAFSGGGAVPLPRKPVPSLFTSRIRRVFAAANAEAGLSGPDANGGEAIWTTNPSRLALFGATQEIVLFRDDISARLRRASVRLKGKVTPQLPVDDDTTMSGALPPADDAMDLDPPRPNKTPAAPDISYDVHTARKLVKTLLDQGHLAPFRQAQRPVHWDYAGALHLYPLPTAMVLVDTSAPPFCVTYEGCHVMNPGSVLVSGRRGVARWVEYEVGRVGSVRECTF
ncbi:DNA polymerase alpha/epsilon subunit B-domain-containing protein [Podospora aff. communis PSN243]|uniref:DNA polymerase epsilon subunit B n=1 Tax=Podospora aff. communis PSN243 TaxID=3040156 RepID=A0AAV9H0K6_9PEZI|nr:DNA polymerase alpha/epsilon subunit B-domain-containing protein [Podospora aff. communis PSN243]